MLEIKIQKVVQQLVEQLLVTAKGRDGEALYFHFDLRMSVTSRDINVSRGLHLLYHLRPGSTYVDVFSAVTPSPFAEIKEVKKWEHKASHDSCWMDVTSFDDVYFEMAEEINQLLLIKGMKKIAPANMHQWHGFGPRRDMFRWVKVSVTRPDPNNSYVKAIEVLE